MVKKSIFFLTAIILISIISCTTNNPTSPGGGGQGPLYVKGIFVLNGNSGTISFLNLENDSINFEFIGTGMYPNDMISSDNKLYVINSGSHTIVCYERNDSGLVVGGILDLGATQNSNPMDLTTDGNNIYISCLGSDEVIVIDQFAKGIIKRIKVGLSPTGIVYNNKYIYVACTGMDSMYNYGDGYIYKISTTNYDIIDSCKVGINSQFLINVNDDLHISCTGDYSNITGKIYIIGTNDTLYIKDSIDIGGTPGRLCYDGNETVYIASGGWGVNGEVFSYKTDGTIINGSSNPIRTPAGAMDLEINDSCLFVVCNQADSLARLKEDSVVQTWAIGDGPTNLLIW